MFLIGHLKRTRESLFGDNYFMFIAFLEQLKT